jgi:hypothetical protein
MIVMIIIIILIIMTISDVIKSNLGRTFMTCIQQTDMEVDALVLH